MRIHKLVNEALTAAEHARSAEVEGRDPRPYIERANDILKNQIGKHPDRHSFFANKKSPFFEVYIELLRKIDQAMYPIHEDFNEHTPKPPLAERFAQIRRKSVPAPVDPATVSPQMAPLTNAHAVPVTPEASMTAADPAPAAAAAKPVDRPRPPIPKTGPLLRMPEPHTEKKQVSNRRDVIQAPVLHKLLLDLADKVLVLDVRDRAAYNEFHIDVPHTACLEFFSISKAVTESDLEDSLVVSPERDQTAFATRHSAKLVVIVDDGIDSHPDAIANIRSALAELRIVILQGGIQAWKAYSLPLTRSTPSPEPPSTTPFTEQLVRNGTVFVKSGMVYEAPRPNQQPISLVHYPQVQDRRAPAVPPHAVQPQQHQPSRQNNVHTQVQPSQGGGPRQGDGRAPVHAQPQYQNRRPSQFMPVEITCGLKNLGNSCYMNCVLQCLFGTSELTGPFLDGSYSSYINPKSRLGYSGRLAHEFSRLVSTAAQPGQQSVAPYPFKQLVGQLQDTFAGYDQQDCQEFLTFLLDGLHEDLNSRGDAPHEPPLSESEERVRESYDVRVAAAVEWERYMKTNASLVVDEVQGQYASRLECTVCHSTSTTYTAFSTLTLPLHSKRGGVIDLENCFDQFLAPQVLDGDNAWFCPQCKKKQKTIQHLKISRLPKILIIHLKRFRQKRSLTGTLSADKLEVGVRYPLYQLNLTKYWTPVNQLSDRDERLWASLPSRSQDPPFIYDLYAVTSHQGSLKSGHYTAYVRKDQQRAWCYFDDTNVARVDESSVVTRNAYVLFYRRRQNL